MIVTRQTTFLEGLLMAKKKSTRKIGRDAETGHFIPVDEAKRRKRTAIVETVTVPKKRKKK